MLECEVSLQGRGPGRNHEDGFGKQQILCKGLRRRRLPLLGFLNSSGLSGQIGFEGFGPTNPVLNLQP